jgi:hypothetical protein
MVDPLADNPPELDTRAEIAEEVRSRGHDPMDIRSNDQLVFGWSLLHGDAPGDRSDETVALEAERIIDAADERGIMLEDPVDVDETKVDDRFLDGDLII